MHWKNIFDHYIAIIFSQLENLEALIQIRLKVYYNNAINVNMESKLSNSNLIFS